MAEVGGQLVYVSFKDAANRQTEWAARISEATAKTYVAAADDAARLLTNVGMMITKTAALSALTVIGYGVRYGFIDDAAVPPAPNSGLLRGNKAVFGFSGSGRGFVTSIPGRDDAAITLTNGTDIVLSDGADVAAWVSQFESTCLDINGNAVTVTYGEVND